MTHIPAVPIDALSNWRMPTDLTEVADLVAGTMGPPQSIWLCADASGGMADALGNNNLTTQAGVTYKAFATGWARPALRFTATGAISGASGGVNISTTSELLVLVLRVDTAPTAGQTFDVCALGSTSDPNKLSLFGTQTGAVIIANNKGNTAQGSVSIANGTAVLAFKVDRSISQMVAYNGLTETLKPTWSAPASSSSIVVGKPSGGNSWWTGAALLWAANWVGSNAEVSDGVVQGLISRIMTGDQ